MADQHSRVGARAALLLGSFVSGDLAQRAIHELGHAIAVWATGGEVYRIVLHPFLEGHCEHSRTAFPTITTLAGAGVSVLAGALIVLATLRYLRPALGPLVMVGIAAFFGNGFYYVVGVVVPFGDPRYLVSSLGVSPILVVLAGAAMVGLGIVAAAATFAPVFGVGPREPVSRTMLMTSAGVLPLYVVSLGYRYLSGTGGYQIAIGSIVVGMASALLVAFGLRVLPARTRLFPGSRAAAEVRWPHAVAPLIVGAAIVVVELIVFD